MMSTFPDIVSSGLIVSATDTEKARMPATIQLELHRLAATLIGSLESGPKCVALCEATESGPSSLWLTLSVASVLGERLLQKVHVLSVIDNSCGRSGGLAGVPSLKFPYCLVEEVHCHDFVHEGMKQVPRRIAELREAGSPILIHVPRVTELPYVLAHSAAIASLVLLVRASRTRRAALTALERQIKAAGITPLGCVLLDRLHPLPKKLYRLL